MRTSPWAYLGGANPVMAADLAAYDVPGPTLRLCGDAQLGNVAGVRVGNQRHLQWQHADDTVTGPWAWDVLRLAISAAVACQASQGSVAAQTDVIDAVIDSYAAVINLLAVQQDATSAALVVAAPRSAPGKVRVAAVPGSRAVGRAVRHNYLRSLRKSTCRDEKGCWRLVLRPGLLTPLPAGEEQQRIQSLFRRYWSRRSQVAHGWQLADVGLLSAGVGALSSPAYLVLLADARQQSYQAVCLRQIPPSSWANSMPAAAGTAASARAKSIVAMRKTLTEQVDPWLGYISDAHHHFYAYAMPDARASVKLHRCSPREIRNYASLCAQLLAIAHARAADVTQVAQSCPNKLKKKSQAASFRADMAAAARDYVIGNSLDYEAFVWDYDKGFFAGG